MKKLSILPCLLIVLVALMSWTANAEAYSGYYTSNCQSCHGTTATCNGCHSHGTHSSSAKNDINVAGATDKTTYAPGETVTVTITGGYRTGWLRAILYDQNMNELARSTGTVAAGAIAPSGAPGYPVTLTAPAPASAGKYTWNVAWYGNKFDLTDAGTGVTFFGPRWTPDPNNPNHGREIVSIAAFDVMAPPPVDPCAGKVCDDANACTTDTCDPATGNCVFTPITCKDANACTTDTCNPASGCVFTPVACQAGQTCDPANGSCVSIDLCAGKVCNDNSACTTDTCNPATGKCVFTAIVCSDNTACTTDTCNPATGCVFTPIVCNDNNPCTTDTCNPATGCVFTPVTCQAGQTCDPANGNCVANDLCAGKVCNDNSACTTDTCDPATGNCKFTPISCDDNNICTDDACNPATGCVHTNNAVSCDNGNACTTGNVCSNGVCLGTPINCDDGDACTVDSCAAGACANVLDCSLPGCSTDSRCAVTGPDVGIVSFRVPYTADCRENVSIGIVAKNFGAQAVTGSITLYKDNTAVKTWSAVTFNPSSSITKTYRYNSAKSGGGTIQWYATVDVPADPNLSNNTSSVETTVVATCKNTKGQ